MQKENKKLQRKRFLGNGALKFLGITVAIAAAGYIAFTLVSLQIELADKRATLAKLEEQKQLLMISNEEKKELIEKSDQDEFVEKIAREYFGFAYPDEQIYIDISGN